MTDLLGGGEELHWIEKGLDIGLRLPFFLLLDHKFKSDFSFLGEVVLPSLESLLNWSSFIGPVLESLSHPLVEQVFYYLEWGFFLSLLLSLSFATSTDDLLNVYNSGSVLFHECVSVFLILTIMNSESSALPNLFRIHYLAVFGALVFINKIPKEMYSQLFYLFAPIFSMLGVPKSALGIAIASILLYKSLLRLKDLSGLFLEIYVTKMNFIQLFGFNVFLEAEWNRLHVPRLLRCFWMARSLVSIWEFFQVTSLVGEEEIDTIVLELGKFFLVKGCETVWAVLGMAAILNSLCHLIDGLFRSILSVEDGSNARTVASVSPFLFFVLALQTGLTNLEPEKRLSRLLKNLCLLLTAIFHIIHDMVSPVLISLTNSLVFHWRKHFRALITSLFLMGSATSLLIYLWDSFPSGTWLFAVSAFCIQLIIKMLISLFIYGLYLYDQFGTDNWESFDEVIYGVKAVGNAIEFIFAVCLFLNGGWIFFFESRGAVRAIMMGIHAYYNIWCEAINGWKSLRKRWAVTTKMSFVRLASDPLVQSSDDVCSICLMEMKAARITSCHHLFHSNCLQRWIYVENNCPLCKTVLFGEDGFPVGGRGEESTVREESLPPERPMPPPAVDTPSSDEDEIIYDAVDNYVE